MTLGESFRVAEFFDGGLGGVLERIADDFNTCNLVAVVIRQQEPDTIDISVGLGRR